MGVFVGVNQWGGEISVPFLAFQINKISKERQAGVVTAVEGTLVVPESCVRVLESSLFCFPSHFLLMCLGKQALGKMAQLLGTLVL